MTDDTDRARIDALEALVRDLKAEVFRLSVLRRRSMRDTYRCASCGGTKILHFTAVQELAHNSMASFALQKEFSAWWGLKHSGGALEAFACRSCRIVEWHAISLDDVKPDGMTVVELDGSTVDEQLPPDPYR